MDPIVWAALLMVLGIGLVILEVFVPSGGILGFLAFAAVLAAIVMAFYYSDSTTGLLFSGVAIVALPAVIALSFHLLPRTAMGRRLLLVNEPDPLADELDPTAQLKQLIGEIGVARSLMLPGGSVEVHGRQYDAVSDGGVPIEAGQAVEVVQVRHERLVVRVTTESPQPKQTSPAPEDDILNRPLDSLGLDELDEGFG